MRVIIVDDDPIVAMSLKVILEAGSGNASDEKIEVIATGSSGREGIDLYAQHKPDIMVMDIRMDDINGIDAATEILDSNKDANILFLTTFTDDEYINKALKLGAKGYILKQDCAGLPEACKAVCKGQIVYGSKVVERLPDLLGRSSSFDFDAYGITDKEQTLIELVADGLSNKEIASKMFIAEGTVRNLMSSVLSKLDLRDRTQLACFYYQQIKP